MNPMWIAYQPPQMLPTVTLNPTATATGAAATGSSKMKRDTQDFFMEPLNKNALVRQQPRINADSWWWAGVAMTAAGGVMYMYSS